MSFARACALCAGLLVMASALDAAAEPVGFVTRDGTRFEINGRPHYYMGASYFNAMNLGANPATRGQLDADFARLRDMGITNVRIWASSEGPGGPDQLTPTLQPSPGIYDEAMFQGLDYALKSAAEHDLRAVMVLANCWDWSGGMNQYVAWSPTTNKSLTNNSWGQGAYHDQFYTDANCRAYYTEFIETVVNRVNTAYTIGEQRAYKDDPTIFSWELANEPRAESAGQVVLNEWITTTSGYIKALDANHMVSTGSEGFFNRPETGEWWDDPAWTGTDFVANHLPDNIDYATAHIWPWNWRWYPQRPDSYSLAQNFLADHLVSAADDLGKPLVLEEFGLPRDNDPDADGSEPPGSPTTERDRYFQGYFNKLYNSAAAGGPGAGSNFWTFQTDPPQEPQGMYSVYWPEDTSTLTLLQTEAARMLSLIPPPGDSNFDRAVNGTDLSVWQQNYDPLGLAENDFPAGDWNADGRIDGGDLALWQQNYNAVGGSTGGPISSIPEPSALVLCLSAAGIGLVLKRRMYV